MLNRKAKDMLVFAPVSSESHICSVDRQLSERGGVSNTATELYADIYNFHVQIKHYLNCGFKLIVQYFLMCNQIF